MGPVKVEGALPKSVPLTLPAAGEWEITAKVWIEREAGGEDVTQNYEAVVPVRVTCMGDGPVQTPEPTATTAPTATIAPTGTASPTATIAPTGTVSPTATIAPTGTASPTATIAPTGTVSPTATIEPTGTISPTATIAPTGTASPTATIAPTGTVSPTATVTPTATPQPSTKPDFDLLETEPVGNLLYDNYLGTGKGLAELEIVYDGEYACKDYELLPVFYGEAQSEDNLLLVCAHPDENGETVRRSLVLTGAQLARLWQEKEVQWLQFRNGDASVLLRVVELLTGDIAKQIDLLTRGEPNDAEDLSLLPDVTLTLEQLQSVHVEIRIAPASEVVEGGYCVEVYLWHGKTQMEISKSISSLYVCLTAEELQRQEERGKFAEAFAITAMDEDEKVNWLDSELIQLPTERMDDLPDVAEHFEARFDSEDSEIVAACDSSVPLEPYRQYALCATWDGNAFYSLAQED